MVSASATIPVGYKQTEVGIIPEDWEVKRLGDLLSVMHGKSQKDVVDDSGSYPILGTGGVMGWTNQYLHDKPCVLIGRKGSIDKPRYMDTPFWSVDTLFYCIIKNNNCAKFLYYKFLEIDWYAYNEASGVPSLNAGTIEKISIVVPNHNEQEIIAKVLTDSDSLIQALETLIVKKRDIKQGTMQELLTGKTRLPGFSGEWELKTLFELAENKKSLFDDGDWIEAEHISESGVRLIQTGNIGIGCFLDKNSKKYISNESFERLKCKEIFPGDLLVCRLAEPSGRACVLPEISENKIITSVDVTIYRPPKNLASRVFLQYIFSTSNWLDLVSNNSGGTTHKRISRSVLGKLKIKIPEINEQEAIAEILSDMDAEIVALEQRLEKAKAIKQGMMQQLLTGRIRLVEPSTSKEASA